MDVIESLQNRNAAFAARDFRPGLKMMPSGKALIVGCLDPRVDPAAIFGLEQGEAGIYRNIGGRVTPALIETLKLLRTVTAANGGTGGPATNLVLLHHTDCGVRHCYHGAPTLLAQHLGIAAGDLDPQDVLDPRRSVARDVAALQADPDMAGTFTVSGLVYDVATGTVETVVPPTRL